MTDPRARTDDLEPFFRSSSVAVIGASARPDKLGRWPIDAMHRLGFAGTITAVNPRHEGDLLGHRCVPKIADLPDEVEAAIVMLPAELSIGAARECGAAGIRHIVIGASGFGETAAGRALQDELVSVVREYDLRLCGPNTDGITHVPTGLALSFQPLFHAGPRPTPGGVSIVSQSGASVSTIGALLTAEGIGLSSAIACGNQLDVTMEDFAGYLAADPATEVVVLFVEGLRDPAALGVALDRCAGEGKRVIALKVGETDSAQRAVTSHTGAVAGAYRRAMAFLAAHGVQCVESLEALAAAARPRRPRTSAAPRRPARTAYVSISGGIAALMADTAARVGTDVVALSEPAARELAAISPASAAMNPYDLAGDYGPEHVLSVLDVFARDDFTSLVFAGGILPEVIRAPMYAAVADAAGRSFDSVHVFSPWFEADDRAVLGRAGVVLAGSLRATIEAQLEPPLPRVARGPAKTAPIAAPPARAGLLDEDAAKTYLAAVGIPRPRAERLAAADGLDRLGGLTPPLVLKGLAPGVVHKSELGLVAVGLAGDVALGRARAEVVQALGRVAISPAEVLVEEMVTGGLETLLGMTRDPVFGPVVAIGFGGAFVELVRDVAILLPPYDRAGVEAALDQTVLGGVLRGHRGVEYDREALVDAALLVQSVTEQHPALESLEINPLFVLPRGRGVVAGDAKLVMSSAD